MSLIFRRLEKMAVRIYRQSGLRRVNEFIMLFYIIFNSLKFNPLDRSTFKSEKFGRNGFFFFFLKKNKK